MLQQLKDRYDRYILEANTAREEAPAMAGFLGFGNDPRKDPCHMAFYRDLEQWTKDFRSTAPDGETVYQAVDWILSAPAQHREEPTYWFMFAAHGLCRELIPMLDGRQCAALAEAYDREFPKKVRLDVHKEVYKLLSRGASHKK